MHPRPLARAVAPLICLALVAGPLPAQASQTIRCESYNMGYRFCRADTDNRVEIARQISNTNCVLDRNWGYARNGVWVNRGCGADFRVGRGGSSSARAPRCWAPGWAPPSPWAGSSSSASPPATSSSRSEP